MQYEKRYRNARERAAHTVYAVAAVGDVYARPHQYHAKYREDHRGYMYSCVEYAYIGRVVQHEVCGNARGYHEVEQTFFQLAPRVLGGVVEVARKHRGVDEHHVKRGLKRKRCEKRRAEHENRGHDYARAARLALTESAVYRKFPALIFRQQLHKVLYGKKSHQERNSEGYGRKQPAF